MLRRDNESHRGPAGTKISVSEQNHPALLHSLLEGVNNVLLKCKQKAKARFWIVPKAFCTLVARLQQTVP